ncbi:MAG: class I SAM-dependent methyltransferase [Planctomycetota bacterium]
MTPDPTDHEYRGMLAAHWDRLRGDTTQWPDGTFYGELSSQDGEPALDVGCGTGRLLLTYLDLGLDVEGVEVSMEMIALCREAAVERGLEPTIHQVAMQDMDLERRYRTIRVPSSSFQLLTEREAARSAMGRFFGTCNRLAGWPCSSWCSGAQGSPQSNPGAWWPDAGARAWYADPALGHGDPRRGRLPAEYARSLRGTRGRRGAADGEPRAQSGSPLVLVGGGTRTLFRGGFRGRARHAGLQPRTRRTRGRPVRGGGNATGGNATGENATGENATGGTPQGC